MYNGNYTNMNEYDRGIVRHNLTYDYDYNYYRKPWKTEPYNKNNYTENTLRYSNKLVSSNEIKQPTNNSTSLDYIANIPITLAKSLEGKYFLGMAADLRFGNATSAWARLYNPPDSGVNLFVFVWTDTDISSTPFKVEVYFNSTPPGLIYNSSKVTPANNTIVPLNQPHVRLEYGVGAIGKPQGGVNAYVRYGNPGDTLEVEEEGKFIFPPGDSFLIFISNPQSPTIQASGTVGFGWWEKPIQ